MIKDIERPSVESQSNPLAGFKKIPVYAEGNINATKVEGFVLSVSKSYTRLSDAAARFIADAGTEYIELLINSNSSQIALVPSSKQSTASRHLTNTKAEKQRKNITTTKTMLAALGNFSNLNLGRFRYRFNGEIVDDGAAGVLIFDISKPRDAIRVKGAK